VSLFYLLGGRRGLFDEAYTAARQGQANHFLRFAKEKIPYGTQRYVGESERLYGILDTRLANRDFVVGPGRGKYSIADISLLGWANMALFSGVDLDRFPNVKAWFDRCTSRPATARGLAIPKAYANNNSAVASRRTGGGEAQAKEDGVLKFLKEAQESYGYKFTSP
jgi:glutathione S-transferase